MKTVKDAMPAGNNDFRKQRTQKPQGNYKQYNDKYGDKPDRQFDKGRYPDRDRKYREERPAGDEWRAEEDETVQKLKQQAKKVMEEAKSEKQDFQRVRLWLNQISPDNFEKKSGELRELLIGNAKLMSEAGFNTEEAKSVKIDEEKQKIVVETIFRKA